MFTQKRKYIYVAILVVLALFICLGSPLSPFGKNKPSMDSSVFLLIGKMMSNGTMPYSEVFDHKGPLLYVINWLGMLVGGIGVWIIELIFLLASMALAYKTARRFFGEEASLLGTIATFIALLNWFREGNFTESYAILFMFGGMYCLTDYFVRDYKLTDKQTFISGLCMGAVLMLRVNLIGVWIGMCAVIFVHTIMLKKYKLLWRYVLFFIAGIVTAILPFILWLYLKGALGAFYHCYLEFNFNYMDAPLWNIIRSTMRMFMFPVVFVATIILIVFFWQQINKKKENQILSIALIATLIATTILVAPSGKQYGHYYMAIIPCILLPITGAIKKIRDKIKIKPAIFILLLGVFFMREFWVGIRDIGKATTFNEKNYVLAEEIKDRTQPDEPVAFIGNLCAIYLKAERFPNIYYPYFSFDAMDNPEMTDKYVEALRLASPRVIMHEQQKFPVAIQKYIDENYTVVYTYEETMIREKNES